MEDATSDKKFVKSQTERRRRERMTCSLEHLRSLLVPQQPCPNHRRAEKAEVLEQTVLFLRSSAEGHRKTDGCHSFQDGFSACLETATHFLGPVGKALQSAVNFDTTLAVRLSRSDCVGLKSASSFTKQHKPSSMSVRRPKRALQAAGRSLRSDPFPARHERMTRVAPHGAGGPGEAWTQQRPSTSDSPSPGLAVFQSLWRPWP